MSDNPLLARSGENPLAPPGAAPWRTPTPMAPVPPRVAPDAGLADMISQRIPTAADQTDTGTAAGTPLAH